MMPSEFSSVAARLVTQRRRDEPLATGNPLPQSRAHGTRTGPHWHVSFPNRWTDSLVDTISSIFTSFAWPVVPSVIKFLGPGLCFWHRLDQQRERLPEA